MLFFLLFIICFRIGQHKSVKSYFGSRNAECIISRRNVNGCCLILCVCHTACGKSFPDQLIQTELISCERFF